MAVAEDENVAVFLATKIATPIAQLGPDLSDQFLRAVRGEVGITWPYNSVTKTFAFLLAEPDVRLRRARGQVRIELHGPSARILSKCSLGAGDELLFALEGATWAKDTSPGGIPGSRVEWQLQFNEKLVLQIKSGETNQLRHLNIDHPELETESEPRPPVTLAGEPRLTTPEPEELPEHVPTIRKFFEIAENEYASPAFVKRARLSYGALFEDGFDPFEEDGGVKGRGRKRTRFGRDSSAWRYTSQSPSPEPTSPARDSMEEDVTEKTSPQSSPQKEMLDEGCQTVYVEMTEPTADEAVQTEAVHTSVQTEAVQTEAAQTEAVQPEAVQTESAMDLLSEAALAQAQQEERSPVAQEQPALATPELPPAIPQDKADEELIHAEPEQPSVKTAENQPSPPAATANTEMPKLDNTQKPTIDAFSTSTLFGVPKTPSFSMFGTGSPARIESPSSIADQVRFGFSHIPHSAPPTDAQDQPHHDPSGYEKNEAYPDSYLDNSPSALHVNNYFAAADTQDLPTPQPPMVENFETNHWTVATQSPLYNQTEGGHFGADALDEGIPMPPGDPALHATDVATDVAPETLPDGFASYGHNHVQHFPNDALAVQEVRGDSQGYGEADDSLSEDAVAVEDEPDPDAAQDEYAYGEPIEEGDYDQRNYVEPSDDDEGLSDQEEEIHREMVDRYGNAEVYDPDMEGYEEEGEDEEDFEGEYDDEEGDEYDGYDDDSPGVKPGYTGRPLPQSNPNEPVVISLLSDSDDDDEPMPTPKAPPAAKSSPPNQAARQNPTIDSEHVEAQLSQEAHESEEEISGSEDEAPEAEEQLSESEDEALGAEDEEAEEAKEEEAEEEAEKEQDEVPKPEKGEVAAEDEESGPEAELSKRGSETLEIGDEVLQSEDNASEIEDKITVLGDGANDSKEEEVPTFVGGQTSSEIEDKITVLGDGANDTKEEEVPTFVGGQTSSEIEDKITVLGDGANNAKEEAAPAFVSGQTHVVDFATHEKDGHIEQARAPAETSASKEDSFVMSAPEDTEGASDSESELEIEQPGAAATKSGDEDLEAEKSGDEDSKIENPAVAATEPEDVKPQADQSDAAVESEADQSGVAVTQSGEEEDEYEMIDDASSGGYDQELEDYYDGMVLEQLEQEQNREQGAASESAEDKMSLASQVEADEDEDMDVEDDQEKASTAEPMSVVDEADDDDVDMIDAGTPYFESPMESETPRAEVVSSMVITEVVEETVIMEVTTESLPEDTAMEQQATEDALEDTQQQEQRDATETVRLEPVNETEEEVPAPVADEEKPTVVTLKPVESTAAAADRQAPGGNIPASPPLTSSFASQKPLSAFAQGVFEAQKEEELPPTPLQSMVQHELEEDAEDDGEATQEAGSLDLGADADQSGINGTEGSPDLSFDAGESEAEAVASTSSAPVRKAAATRSSKRNKNKKKASKGKNTHLELPESPSQSRAVSGDAEEEITVHTPSTQEHMSPQPEMAASSSSSPDVSVKLAQQSLAVRRSKRGQPQPQEQPVRTSPRLSRRRSGSLQSSNQDAEEEHKGSFTMPSNQDLSVLLAKGALASPSKGDVSVNLAKDALNSPSKSKSASAPVESNSDNNASTATLKADLTKRLRKDFPDCISLTSLKFHVEKFPVVVAIVTTEPAPPVRAKGGPREYVMSFHITDPSIAPSHVVEVQIYRPHKESLPIVKVGDAILLQRLQVKSISKKGFGLRSGEESSWAVFDADEGAPQIKGAPVEDWEEYREYMTTLRAWWRSLDGAARGKVERADKKMKEAK
ncbi:hypothetical protein B0T21DRAFT_347079 [Apiosordaria backusii]|uniref:Telomeric single stranded DNA binding POT1/Cdc13 domain-containing protein n=1 Tax=Apiosordaria backusii TaxID=314023 RepID=A0AA40BSX7_9PEZI|nr:hypothetical protein B0T21DRAFT_347079 [Apiosordaria backusii]